MPAAEPAADDEAAAAPAPLEAPAAEDSVAADAESAGAEAQPADGQLQLLVTYSGDCWTEVTDASGRRLFFGMGTNGRTVELSGDAPFNVLFGNAANVRIRVNGADRPIVAAERSGRTARLTIAGT